MLPVQIDAGQGIGAVIVASLTIIGTILIVRIKGKSDETTAQTGASETVWRQTQDQLDRLEGTVKRMREENDRITSENRRISGRLEELWEENNRLHAENQDQQELIREVAEYILQNDVWIAKGSPPPPPPKPQKIAQHVEQIRRKYQS